MLLILMFFSGVANALTPLTEVSAKGTASNAIELKDPDSKVAVRELVSRLNDAAVRDLLIERLDAVAEANEMA
ncbi:MAG: hypothetical protein ACJAYB_003435, partial [Psychromonas sp.]